MFRKIEDNEFKDTYFVFDSFPISSYVFKLTFCDSGLSNVSFLRIKEITTKDGVRFSDPFVKRYGIENNKEFLFMIESDRIDHITFANSEIGETTQIILDKEIKDIWVSLRTDFNHQVSAITADELIEDGNGTTVKSVYIFNPPMDLQINETFTYKNSLYSKFTEIAFYDFFSMLMTKSMEYLKKEGIEI